MADKEERIRIRAYQIWEREGRLDGRHEHNWEEARREIEAEDAAGGRDPEMTDFGNAGKGEAAEPDIKRSPSEPVIGSERRSGPASASKAAVRGRPAKRKPDGANLNWRDTP